MARLEEAITHIFNHKSDEVSVRTVCLEISLAYALIIYFLQEKALREENENLKAEAQSLRNAVIELTALVDKLTSGKFTKELKKASTVTDAT